MKTIVVTTVIVTNNCYCNQHFCCFSVVLKTTMKTIVVTTVIVTNNKQKTTASAVARSAQHDRLSSLDGAVAAVVVVVVVVVVAVLLVMVIVVIVVVVVSATAQKSQKQSFEMLLAICAQSGRLLEIQDGLVDKSGLRLLY